MNKQIAVIWLSMVLLLGFVVIVVEMPTPAMAGNIWVDDDYPTEDATHKKTIQAGINAANPGDTVFVYNGTYYENVVVAKTINLTGISRDNTTIDASDSGEPLVINANWVNVTGFKVTRAGWGGYDSGIDVKNAQYCKIYNNSAMSNNRCGIYIQSSSYNLIINNQVQIQNNYGIRLKSSSYNDIEDNYVASSGYGIWVESSSHNDFIGNIVTSNSANGIQVQSSSNSNLFSGNDISSNDKGIRLSGVLYNKAVGNTLTGNINGLHLDGSPYNTMKANNVTGSSNGIFLTSSSFNEIYDNNVYSNGAGIWCESSSNTNLIQNNNITNNGDGIYHGASSKNNINANFIQSNTNHGIYFVSASMNNITGNSIVSNGEGIYFSSSSNSNIIKGNNISNNGKGIYFWNSPNSNKIIANNISLNTEYGLRFVAVSNTLIYFNNIIDNTIQAYDDAASNIWNDTYPAGGNYWSDFDDFGDGAYDDYQGPDQDILGSDGIVDNGTGGGGGKNPYAIDSDSQDNYPLIEPFINLIMLKQGWNLVSIPTLQQDQNINVVLEEINGYYDAVQWYNSIDISDPWKHYKVGKPFGNDLFNLNESMGFWIHITQPGDTVFLFNGTQPSTNQSITLHPGWNMVGYPSLSSRNRSAALNNIIFDQDVDAIWTFDAATQSWQEIGPTDYFKLGTGYWVHSKVTKVWIVPL